MSKSTTARQLRQVQPGTLHVGVDLALEKNVSLYGALLPGTFWDPFPRTSSALTIYQIRILLACVLPKPTFDIPAAIHRVQYCQKRNYVAYVSHRKSKWAQLASLSANVAQ